MFKNLQLLPAARLQTDWMVVVGQTASLSHFVTMCIGVVLSFVGFFFIDISMIDWKLVCDKTQVC